MQCGSKNKKPSQSRELKLRWEFGYSVGSTGSSRHVLETFRPFSQYFDGINENQHSTPHGTVLYGNLECSAWGTICAAVKLIKKSNAAVSELPKNHARLQNSARAAVPITFLCEAAEISRVTTENGWKLSIQMRSTTTRNSREKAKSEAASERERGRRRMWKIR